jgi:hypothetical protein
MKTKREDQIQSVHKRRPLQVNSIKLLFQKEPILDRELLDKKEPGAPLQIAPRKVRLKSVPRRNDARNKEFFMFSPYN